MISAITASYDTRDEWPERIRSEVESLEREWIDAQPGRLVSTARHHLEQAQPDAESVTDRCTKSTEYCFCSPKARDTFTMPKR